MDDVTYVYCLKGKLGFLSDSEWDGDSFSSDPIHAYQYENPTTGGRMIETYSCVRIKIITHHHGKHMPSSVIPVKCQPHGVIKIRYKCKCSRCASSTKNYALPETAISAYSKMLESECTTKSWEYA